MRESSNIADIESCLCVRGQVELLGVEMYYRYQTPSRLCLHSYTAPLAANTALCDTGASHLQQQQQQTHLQHVQAVPQHVL